MKNFISPAELDQLDDVIILDVRQSLTEPEYGIMEYKKEHLRGAFYLNLETDLSGPATEESGNHPLPEREVLKEKLQSIGATNESIFVIYDEGSNFTAGRAWFVLKYFGLEKVYVLNGGIQAAKKDGYAMSDERPREKQSYIELSPREDLLASYEEVLALSKEPREDSVVIDARSQARYLGLEEPLYAIPGHIPNAVNLEYTGNFDSEGKLLSRDELEKRFAPYAQAKDIILSCGSGVTACANFIAMDEVGLKPRLYVGSYSQWLKKGNKVVQGS